MTLQVCVCSKDEFINDPALKQLVAEQAKEWSELVGRHLKEEWTLLKEQLEAQQDILKTVMMGAQGAQLKQLDAKLEKLAIDNFRYRVHSH